MAVEHGKTVRVYVNGQDLSGDLNSITPNSMTELAPYATFGVTGYKYIPGLAADEVTFDALFDGGSTASTAEAVVEALRGATTSGHGMMIAFGSTVGTIAYSAGDVKLKSHKVTSVVTDITRFTADFSTEDTPFDEGRLLTTGKQTTVTSTIGVPLDFVAAVTTGATAYLHVMQVSTGTFTARILDSADNITYTTTGTFAAASSNETQKIAISGAVKRYVAAGWTNSATTSTIFAIAIKR